MKKYIRIKLEGKTQKCPICNRLNNFVYGDVCDHVEKITVKKIVFYRNK